MPFNFYAETSFTEMGGHGFWRPQNCRLNPQLSKDNYPRMVGIQSYEQQFTLFCHGLDYKNFSAK